MCSNHIIRRFVLNEEILSILQSCRAAAYGDTSEDTEQQQKFFNQVIISPLSLEILTSLLSVVTYVKEQKLLKA